MSIFDIANFVKWSPGILGVWTLFSTQLLLLGPAFAQVNTEKLRRWDSAGFSGNLDVAFDVARGNTDLIQFGSGVRLQYAILRDDPGRSVTPTSTTTNTTPNTTTSTTTTATPSATTASAPLASAASATTASTEVASSDAKGSVLQDLFYLTGNLNIGRQNGDAFLNNGFAHARWTHMWTRMLGTELFGQLQFDEFIRLRERLLAGAGFRGELLRSEFLNVVLGTGYMLEYEALDLPPGVVDDGDVFAHRWTSYLSVKAGLEVPEVQFVNTVYVQPRITDFDDYRVLDEAELELAVLANLKFAVGLSLRYDSLPPSDVESFDISIKNKLRLSF
ncbi:MAG: DUF481 domain-containing protein [Deltaproteobacteria bacterium]|nr:DUF481 domain-containing protein [Deltaproteobacteria bacterium]